MSIYEVAIIGAGPAGTSAAIELLRLGCDNVVLVDAGRSWDHRPCPVDRLKSCHGCGGVCNVVAGFGGSIHPGDGLKLSKFPSGRRLAELIGPPAESMMDRALAILSGSQEVGFLKGESGISSVRLKEYEVALLSSGRVLEMVSRLHQELLESKATLALKRRVVSLAIGSDGYSITTLGPDRQPLVIKSKRVIVATGRLGLLWWRKTLRDLGVDHAPPVISMGIRIEGPTEFFQGAADVHPDYKASFQLDGKKFKTFCYCSGAGGGRLKFADYGPWTLLDGHVIPSDEEETSSLSNFALLHQLTDGEGLPRSFDWTSENILRKYVSMNPGNPGKPVKQRLDDFLGRFSDIEPVRPAPSLLRDAVDAPIVDLFSDLRIDAFRSALEQILGSIQSYSSANYSFEQLAASCNVFALELEGLWDVLSLSPSMETSRDGLYACGDCAGHAQGVLQAATSGVTAARQITST